MDLLIFTSSLGYSKCIGDDPFISSAKNKFQPYITLFTKYLALYKIECKTHYILYKKNYKI